MIDLDPNGVPIDAAPDTGLVTDGVRNPVCAETPKPSGCFSENRATLHLHGGITPVDQRRHAAPVDHPCGREHRLSQGRQRQQRSGHARSGRRRGDVLLHQPAERAVDVLPRPLLGHHPAERLCGRGRRLPPDRSDGAEPGRSDRRPRRPRRRHPADRPGQDVRAETRPRWLKSIRPGDRPSWGGEGSLWTPHVYMPAQNPGRPVRHERVRTLDVRALVLAAGEGRQVPADRQPVLRPRRCDPERRADSASRR